MSQDRKAVERQFRIFRKICDKANISLDNLLKGKVLDAGCGHGWFVDYMLEKGVNCYGVENDEETVNRARQIVREPNRIILGDIRNMPFEDQSFDLVYSNFIYDFIDDFKDVKFAVTEKSVIMKDICRVLKKDRLYLLADEVSSLVGVNCHDFKILETLGSGYLCCFQK